MAEWFKAQSQGEAHMFQSHYGHDQKIEIKTDTNNRKITLVAVAEWFKAQCVKVKLRGSSPTAVIRNQNHKID